MTGMRRARLAMMARLLRERRLEHPRQALAFLRVRRHEFVPAELRDSCYGPDALELEVGQTVTCPEFVAQMTGLLHLRPGARVLEVGTGTGYQAAILAAMGAQVVSIELRPALYELARRHMRDAKVKGVELRLGDGALGAPDLAPFDGVVMGCAPEVVPPALLEQLTVGGRLVAPVGPEDRLQTLTVVHRTAKGFERRAVRAAWFVPMG